MSQIVRIRIQKTLMKDKVLLIQAIEDAGYTCEQPKFVLFGLRAQIRIRGRQIGFNKAGDFYEMVSRRESQAPQILQDISQRYIYHLTRQKLEAQGFEVASEEKQKDGRIHLVLRRMA
jgi:hypothetical protein